LFSNVRYQGQSGTSVPRDFVELPSQILENWAFEPALLREYAFHCETGEAIPDALIDKIRQVETFNQGFYTTEYVAATLLDMEYHRLEGPLPGTVAEFEHEVLINKYGLVPQISPRYHSSYFQHIFSGGYSAGYYSYLWSEVLDADAFEAFKENGVFDRKTAAAFREHVLSKGGSQDPMALYKAFRGKAPMTEPLLRRRGFL
jgi:peptidyl-dipeptidase Dcp